MIHFTLFFYSYTVTCAKIRWEILPIVVMFRNMQHCSLQPEPYVMIAIHFCHNIFARMLSNDYVGSFFTSKGFLDLLLLIPLIPLLLSVSFYTVPFLFLSYLFYRSISCAPEYYFHFSMLPFFFSSYLPYTYTHVSKCKRKYNYYWAFVMSLFKMYIIQYVHLHHRYLSI